MTTTAEQWEINERITQLLGWHALKVEPVIFEGDEALIGHYRIVNEWVIADANDVPLMRPWATEELAWEHAPTPDYCGDLNTAWELFAALPDDWTPRLVRMLTARGGVIKHGFVAGIRHNITDVTFDGLYDTPSEAISRVWIRWREAQS